MIELWIVRHGQTDWNVEGRYQGQTDIPLNQTGQQQAQQLAESLPALHFAAIYTSDLTRAHTTAKIIADRIGLSPIPDRRLREMSHGDWEGCLVRDKIHRLPDGSDPPVTPGISNALGGESILQVAERAAHFANEVATLYPAQRVLIVTHGVTAAVLKCQSLGISFHQIYQHIPHNTTLLTIHWPPTKQPEELLSSTT